MPVTNVEVVEKGGISLAMRMTHMFKKTLYHFILF
jgi:hypothetical protein